MYMQKEKPLLVGTDCPYVLADRMLVSRSIISYSKSTIGHTEIGGPVAISPMYSSAPCPPLVHSKGSYYEPQIDAHQPQVPSASSLRRSLFSVAPFLDAPHAFARSAAVDRVGTLHIYIVQIFTDPVACGIGMVGYGPVDVYR